MVVAIDKPTPVDLLAIKCKGCGRELNFNHSDELEHLLYGVVVSHPFIICPKCGAETTTSKNGVKLYRNKIQPPVKNHEHKK